MITKRLPLVFRGSHYKKECVTMLYAIYHILLALFILKAGEMINPEKEITKGVFILLALSNAVISVARMIFTFFSV